MRNSKSANFHAVLVARSSNLSDFHISPSRTRIPTPFSVVSAKNTVSEHLYREMVGRLKQKILLLNRECAILAVWGALCLEDVNNNYNTLKYIGVTKVSCTKWRFCICYSQSEIRSKVTPVIHRIGSNRIESRFDESQPNRIINRIGYATH